ncbi:MAG: LysR family transcriptional regulator [Gammaproteobacteria bacterium]|nr:LysR family transcriptional regulator [Gammaproteobacteria bacterium]MBU0785523.1 LysR family transcriptional regulator [Gammaproteobacteria bacterium]MBU0816811.1 LysR family transcriptional regulator [Gammaproteobacteria bacterium]MBU1786975.1 LysR family transcriptional regulator [Gammaproteobacteria bacterium]
MNVTFRQLRLFLALAETGSVSGAARAMHVTQPTASMQLRDVTEAVGLPLYEVVARRVHLTETGLELARTARLMAAEWDAFGQRVDALKGLTRGRLKVAVVSTAKYFIPRMLGQFCSQYPDIDISLEVLNRDGVVGRLRENLDDLYIMSRPPTDTDLQDDVFLPNPLVLIASKSHLLAKRRGLPVQALRGTRFILREQGSGTRLATDEHLRKQRFTPDLRLELGSNEAVREAVAGDLGVAVISVHALAGQPATQGVTVLDVQGFPIQSQWHIVYPRGKRLSPIAQVFREHLVAQAAQWAQRQHPARR